MSTFGKTLRKLRKANNLTQTQLANSLGLAFSTISMYERGVREPDFETLETIADYFNVTMDYLHGKQGQEINTQTIPNILSIPNMKQVPLLGTIACGEPILAVENIEGDVSMPEHIRADFALRAKGDSMTDARINDGDIVYIRMQAIVENGEIAAVLIDNEATLKRFYQKGDTVTLMPCNNKYAPFTYTGAELNDIRILGKAVGFTSTDI